MADTTTTAPGSSAEVAELARRRQEAFIDSHACDARDWTSYESWETHASVLAGIDVRVAGPRRVIAVAPAMGRSGRLWSYIAGDVLDVDTPSNETAKIDQLGTYTYALTW